MAFLKVSYLIKDFHFSIVTLSLGGKQILCDENIVFG